jgi:hypothetical protein
MIEVLERALSIRQPYAETILTGEKKNEYRSRQTHIRGRVYIYAGKKTCDLQYDEPETWEYPRGLIVGSVEIVNSVPFSDGTWVGWAWVLHKPMRYESPWKPKGTPQPSFWRATR